MIKFTRDDLITEPPGIPTLSKTPNFVNRPLAIVDFEFTLYCGKPYVILEDFEMGLVKTCSTHVHAQSLRLSKKLELDKDFYDPDTPRPYVPAIIKDVSGHTYRKFMLLPLSGEELDMLKERLALHNVTQI